MKKIIHRKWTFCLLTLLVFTSLFIGSFFQMRSFEKYNPPIELTAHSAKTIVFYRDDCPNCQAVFPLLYYHNLFNNDLVFVNMNQPLNRRYIQEYRLKSVPTIINNEQHYSGTNKKRILQFIHQSFK